ncbi:MAG: DUF4339 domain-containing protein [Planctomycetes bacterium]|nr:DUF4339 domain-containing protein [Planctomycetota bacterium]
MSKGEKRFHYLKDGKPVGPVPFAELKQLADSGQIKPTDYVWPEGAPN